MGGFVFFDSAIKLVRAEHPPIGVIQLFGQEVWLGWVMIAALVYSGLPAVFLGRAKLRLADDLHDKVLYADAQMNKADWMTVTAAIGGAGGDGAAIADGARGGARGATRRAEAGRAGAGGDAGEGGGGCGAPRGPGLMKRLEGLAEHLLSLEWKVYDIVVVPVREIDIPSPGVTVGGQDSSASGSR